LWWWWWLVASGDDSSPCAPRLPRVPWARQLSSPPLAAATTASANVACTSRQLRASLKWSWRRACVCVVALSVGRWEGQGRPEAGACSGGGARVHAHRPPRSTCVPSAPPVGAARCLVVGSHGGRRAGAVAAVLWRSASSSSSSSSHGPARVGLIVGG